MLNSILILEQGELKGNEQADSVINEGLGSVGGLTGGTKALWGSS